MMKIIIFTVWLSLVPDRDFSIEFPRSSGGKTGREGVNHQGVSWRKSSEENKIFFNFITLLAKSMLNIQQNRDKLRVILLYKASKAVISVNWSAINGKTLAVLLISQLNLGRSCGGIFVTFPLSPEAQTISIDLVRIFSFYKD